MHYRQQLGLVLLGVIAAGCGEETPQEQLSPQIPTSVSADIRTVRLHFDGFTKSSSGATWMAWPNKVKQALEGLEAVSEIRMDLERDEFVVRYDGSLADVSDLIAASEAVGFPAQVVSDPPETEVDPPFYEEAMARARREQKPLVLDFTAEWCAPCQRMINETFPDRQVAPLLDRCVLVEIDTDEHPGLAQKYGVVGLPDIRLLTPDGTEVRRLRDFQTADALAGVLEDLLATAATGAAESAGFVDLTDGENELRDAFNADRGQVRLILILSPTWGPCQNGARVVRETILESLPDEQIRVYVVWTPVLREDDRAQVRAATNFIQHDRVQHFWDNDKSLGNLFGSVVTLPRQRTLAWDVYLLFDGEATWTDQLPVPADWMHQLAVDERTLDGGRLHTSIQGLLRQEDQLP